MRSTGKALAAIVCMFCSFQGHGALAQEKPSEEKANAKSSVELPMEVEEILSDSGKPKTRRPVDPEIQLADKLVNSISQVEIEWRQAGERLDAAMTAQMKHFNLFSEAETSAAMKAYAIKLKASGEDLLKAYADLTRRNIDLKGMLTRGPAYLQEVAATYEQYANEETFDDIKQQYFDLRDIWLARAKIFEKRSNEIDDHYDKDFIPYLRGWNRFLDRLIPTLDYTFPFDRANEEAYTRFARQLTEHMNRLNKLTDSIGKWRAKALEQAEDPQIRQEEVKGKTSSLLNSHGVPFARSQRAKEITLAKQYVDKLLPGDTVLIVGYHPPSNGIRYYARAKLKEKTESGTLELLDDYKHQPGHLAILPLQDLPGDIKCGDDLRTAHKNAIDNHSHFVAERQASDLAAEQYMKAYSIKYDQKKRAEERMKAYAKAYFDDQYYDEKKGFWRNRTFR